MTLATTWTLLFAIGVCFSAWNLIQGYRDLFGIWEYHINGDAEGEARLVIGAEWLRLIEQVAGTAAGICAILHVFPNAILVLLFVLPVGLTLNSIRSARYRVRYSQAHYRR